MRFLHTADWHLGRQIRGRSRTEEFRAVLTEIAEIAVSEGCDAVLVAGDIWDSTVPSAEADRLLFDALRSLVDRDIEVVLTSGNHDNPRRLEALGRLARPLGIYARGFIRPPAEGGWVVIERGGERAEIAAIPWVPDGRALSGIELLEDFDVGRALYQESVEEIYRQLAAGYTPGALHLLVGHLFVDGAQLSTSDGSERRLHIDVAFGVDAGRLPPGPQYLALGHIHRPQEIRNAPNGAAAYAGSVLQLDFGEAGEQKEVRVVDLGAGRPAEHRSVPLTAGRELRELRGAPDEVVTQAESAGDAHIRAVLTIESPEPGLVQRFREQVPAAVDVRLDYDRSDEQPGDIAFADMAPEALFVRYFERQHGAVPSPELLALFRELVGEAEKQATPRSRPPREAGHPVKQATP